MKVNVYTTDGGIKSSIDLPEVFSTPLRSDLIKRAFRIISLNARQPYGANPQAGMRRVGHNWGPNHGVSRIPRMPNGSRAVMITSARGGRNIFAPRAVKNLDVKMNHKEMRLARFSAVAFTADEGAVRSRGHRVPEIPLPVIVDDSIESVSRVKDAVSALQNLGLYEDIERARNGVRIRAGRGKTRGRKYRKPKSILLVLKNVDNAKKAFSNLAGVDVVSVDDVNVAHLSPGGQPGRLTVFSESAIDVIRGWKR